MLVVFLGQLIRKLIEKGEAMETIEEKKGNGMRWISKIKIKGLCLIV